jgi:Short C-terminal domain
VDFRVRGESFEDADRQYAELARQRDAGSITDEEFEARRQQLMVRDEEGRWWAKLGEAGEWHRRDGGNWVPAYPPNYQDPEPARSELPAKRLPPEGGGDNRRRRLPLWIGLFGTALIGAVLVVWVLVPYLQGEGLPRVGELVGLGQEGDSGQGGQGGQSQGAAFDAVFVHRASPNNISANSTYIDNPLTNGNPDAVLIVTQNWNPGGRGGTYNDHSVGVWYDSGRKKWAIFNQDRKAMTEDAAFNVAVR